MNNEILFKVKCIDIDNDCLTVGKEYNVVEVDKGFYKVENDSGEFWWYCNNRFEILDRESNPKDKQEFSVGDEVIVNKISDDYVPLKDKNVKEGDIATVIKVSGCDLELSNHNWRNAWWFSRNDLSLVGDASPLSNQEVIQATLDDKDVEIKLYDFDTENEAIGFYIRHQESTCYSLSCGNEYVDNYIGEDVDIFKYCPYCGGEIEFSKV